jgi:uncharacterized membrane protein
MNNAATIPATRIKMMQASMRCLVLGLLGLLPIIGVPFALAALWSSYSARKFEGQFWNPAKPQRILGLICAAIGALIWGAVDTIIIYHACNNYANS